MFTMGAQLNGDDYSSKKKEIKHYNENNMDKNQHQLVFMFEKRNGKPVTLVGKFSLVESEKKEILKLLKKKLACGGSINNEWLEIQGDKKIEIQKVLESNGWKFRKK